MANEVFKGLFGFSPEELTRQREAADTAMNYQAAQLDPFQQARFQGLQSYSSAARNLNTIGQKLFDIEDPQMRDSTVLDGAFQELVSSGGNPMSTQGIDYIIAKAQQGGVSPKGLERLLVAKNQAQMQEAKLASEQALANQRNREGKANLPSEIQIAQTLNDPNVPEDVKKALREQVFREKSQNSPEFIKLLDAYEAAPEGSERKKNLGRLIESEISGRATRGKTEVNVNQPVPPSPKKIGEAAGDVIGKAIAGVGSQEEIIRNSRQALDYLKNGIYTGPYAEAQKLAAKYSRGAVGDLAKVANTESFLNTVRNNVIPLLTAFGGNDSNEEKQFLERLVGGDTTLEPDAIQRAIETGIAKAEANIAKLRAQISAAESGQSLSTTINNPQDPLGVRNKGNK